MEMLLTKLGYNIIISKEFKNRLIIEGIEPSNIINIITKNDKNKRKIITIITLMDDSKIELIDDYIFYAARKNKRW